MTESRRAQLSDEQVDRLVARLDTGSTAIDPFAGRLFAVLEPVARGARDRDRSLVGQWLFAVSVATASLARSMNRSPRAWQVAALLATLLLAGALVWAGAQRRLIPASQLGFRPVGQHLIEGPSYRSLPALLVDGRVLILRGASLDVYDPKTDEYTFLRQAVQGSQEIFLAAQTLSRLPDGRLLLANSPGATGLLDPVTGDVTPGPTLPQALGQAYTATVLLDGRVLFAGGELITDDPAPPFSMHEAASGAAFLFDPATMTATSTGSMSTPRFDHTATLLADGRVLLAGGTSGADPQLQPVASAELYDPRTGTFSPAASMPTARSNATAARLADGRVLVAGGGEYDIPDASAVLYDPATNSWVRTGSLAQGRSSPSSVVLADGRVLVMGGRTWFDAATVDTSADYGAELYDPVTRTFSPTGRASLTRSHATLILLPDGEVFVTSPQQGVPGVGPDELFGPIP